MRDFLRFRLQELLTIPYTTLLMCMHRLQMGLNSRRSRIRMVTTRTNVRSVAYMGVDVHANVVYVVGAGTVGTGEELFADFEVEEVLGTVGKD